MNGTWTNMANQWQAYQWQVTRMHPDGRYWVRVLTSTTQTY
jgi:hypothetical protein